MLDMLMGGPPGGGSPMGGPGGGTSDPSQQAFASGILAGAGLREISQVLGLSKKRQARMGAGGAMPSSGQMVQGNLGDMDRILLLAKMQAMMGGAPGGPEAVPPMPANPAMGGVAPLPPLLPPPVGPMVGSSMLGAAPIGGLGPMAPGPVGPPMPGANPYGGELPMALLQQMLGSAGGIV